MVTRDELVVSLNDMVSTVLQVELMAPEDDLVTMGLMDSFGLVNVLFALEEGFGVSVTLEDLDAHNFRSICGMAAFLEQRLS